MVLAWIEVIVLASRCAVVSVSLIGWRILTGALALACRRLVLRSIGARVWLPRTPSIPIQINMSLASGVWRVSNARTRVGSRSIIVVVFRLRFRV